MAHESTDERPSPDSESPRRGRKRKFPLDTVRERMIEASLDRLLETGVYTRLDAVRIDHVLVSADVPRGSAYTAWADNDRSPQENLQHAVMLRILEATTGNSAGPTKDYTLEIVDELADQINSADVTQRRKARAEITRRVARFNHERLDSTMWKLYRSLVLTVSTQPEPDAELVESIEAGEQKLVDIYTDLFTEFASLFQMTLKPGTTFEQLAISMIALNDGLANHSTEAFDQSSPMTIDGKEWTTYGFCCEALYDAFFDMN